MLRVAICIPSLDMVPAQFAERLALLASNTRQFPIALVNARHTLLPMARDKCINAVAIHEKQNGASFSHVFFWDSDVLLPSDALTRLAAHDKDIVGATYIRRSGGEFMVQSLDGENIDAKGGLVEVAGLPLGCILVRRAIFDQLKRPYFRLRVDEEREVTVGEDYVFCEMVRALGYKVWCDVGLTKQTGHIASIVRSFEPAHSA